ncbi:MAG: rod shape-determining protein MreC [Hyphomicrobiaceae bacterium]|nr:rod shape-determining protein MreC [Hyphomicrobiaceae bacterium]
MSAVQYVGGMAVLRDDAYSRGGQQRRRRHVSGLHFALLFAALVLMVLSRLEHSFIRLFETAARDALLGPARVLAGEVAALRASWSAQWAGPIQPEELRRLRADARAYREARLRVQELEAKLAALERVAGVAPKQQATFLGARVVATANGPFGRAVTIDAGREAGVRYGYPVVDARGYLGHVAAVGVRSARVILATDIGSRVPVVVVRSNVDAIAVGDNSETLRLALLPRGADVRDGDLVMTSGAGGVMPKGMRVGVIKRFGREFRVTPVSPGLPGEFVRVVFHEPEALDSLIRFKRQGRSSRLKLKRDLRSASRGGGSR